VNNPAGCKTHIITGRTLWARGAPPLSNLAPVKITVHQTTGTEILPIRIDMDTMLKVARIILPDGWVMEGYCIAIDERGRISRYIQSSEVNDLALDRRIADESTLTLMPPLADTHVHLGISDGITESADFRTPSVIDDELSTYLRAGVGHMLSPGTDQPWVQQLSQARQQEQPSDRAVPYSAGCGFGAKDGWPPELTGPQLRYRPIDAAVAKENVDTLAKLGVKAVKLWVDDFGGSVPRLPYSIAEAVVTQAHQLGLKVFAHVFTERDARELVGIGVDVLAHSIRAGRIEDEVAGFMAEHGVKIVPTLVREEVPIAFSMKNNPYLSDPLFQQCAGPRLDALERESGRVDSQTALKSQRSLDIAMGNLRRLADQQVEVCLGTDAGFRLKLPGFSQHRELQLMSDAGMKPERVLAAALKNNYDLFATGASDLSAGNSADFMLVEGNPLTDIRDVSKIRQIWRRGSVIPNGETYSG
jgi:imidazolonepropionase-like amidohydrolase